MDDGERHTGALSFRVRSEGSEGVTVRKLGMKCSPEDFTYRMFAWNKPVEAIEIRDYGTMNGEKVVKHVAEVLGD